MQKSYDDLSKKFSSIEDSLVVGSNNSKMNKLVKYFDNKLTLSNKISSPTPTPTPPQEQQAGAFASNHRQRLLIDDFSITCSSMILVLRLVDDDVTW